MSPKPITEILPTDILEIITEHLAAPLDDYNFGDDSAYNRARKDLSSCSLTCLGFLPLCQQHIFKNVDFPVGDTAGFPFVKTSIARFAKVVQTTPAIGSYVRAITLWFNDMEEVNYSPDIISVALRPLINLRTVEFQGLSDDFFDWNHLPPAPNAEIHRLFQLPMITTVYITSIHNFNPRVLAPCSRLETLVLVNASIADHSRDASESTVFPIKPIQPLRLDIAGYNQPLQKIMTSKLFDRRLIFNFDRLRVFTFDFYSGSANELNGVSDFLQLNIPSLETIKLTFLGQGPIDANAPLFHNDSLKTIKNLTICCSFWDIEDNHLTVICTWLQTLTRNNQLESLRLCFTYQPGYSSDAGNDPNWDVLNDILLAPGWPSLNRFELQIFSTRDRTEEGITLAESLGRLPETRLRGLSSSRSFNFIWDFKSRP